MFPGVDAPGYTMSPPDGFDVWDDDDDQGAFAEPRQFNLLRLICTSEEGAA